MGFGIRHVGFLQMILDKPPAVDAKDMRRRSTLLVSFEFQKIGSIHESRRKLLE